MGTYLSTPNKDKGTECGEDEACANVPLAWAVVDMQGWRKSMEDAHVAATGLPYSSKQADAKVFGVFDGHGGAEVARFCQLYLVSVLQQQPTWNAESIGGDSTTELNGVAAAGTPEGQALIQAFHALDRMIDDDARRDEIINLRSTKPMPQERRDATSIPLPGTSVRLGTAQPDAEPQNRQPNNDSLRDTHDDANDDDANDDEPFVDAQLPQKDAGAGRNGVGNNDGDDKNRNELSDDDGKANAPDAGTADATDAASTQPSGTTEKSSQNSDDKQKADETDGSDDNDSEDPESPEDDDSNEAVGKEEAAELDQDLSDTSQTESETLSEDGSDQTPTMPSSVTHMFQKILSLGGQAGQATIKLVGEGGEELAINLVGNKAQGQQQMPSSDAQPSVMSQQLAPLGPNASQPTLVRNGRMICNLPDHPIHAGCTAIVALMTGKTLTVANAGDSRAVLCRAGGKTHPLSFDHKPQQAVERARITKAGGFINHFGRVNGNLNLSRSIGDLKYKQVPNIDPADQMITAQPDIVQLELAGDDEFIILACDGIWDCLSNEQAMQYVRSRIETRTPEEIGIEMLDNIISHDPRLTQGIGSDNMTVMIIDLQPASRTQRGSSPSAVATTEDGNEGEDEGEKQEQEQKQEPIAETA